MMKLLTKGDKILISLILILNSIPLFIPMIHSEDSGNKTIIINVDGKVIQEIPLINEKDSKLIDFSFSFNDKIYDGKLETKEGKVRLLRLPKEITPKSIHADMGWISKENQMIVALPVKLVITVQGEKDKDVDIISY